MTPLVFAAFMLIALATTPAAHTSVSVSIEPKEFAAFAIAPNGNLVIADDGRDQILERHAGGSYSVIAGSGIEGFSGDGGLATRAELDRPEGIAVAGDGTIYFVDGGNERVRAILPNGIIETVAGRGSGPLNLISGPTPATEANFYVGDVAIGPGGSLYISTEGPGQVLRLTPTGLLDPARGPFDGEPARYNPVPGVHVDPSNLAFNSAGDMFIANGNNFGVVEVYPSGASRSFIGNFRGDAGSDPVLATASSGRTIVADRDGLFWIDGVTTRSVAGFSDSILGQEPHSSIPNVFMPDAVAIANDGDIYTATNVGNTFTSVTALAEITPSGHMSILWKSTPKNH